MSKIYRNDEHVKFLFFTNYKVMNSNLANMLKYYFPGIHIYTSNKNLPDSNEYIRLAIVRNPYDRLLSLFYDKCRAHPFKIRNRDHKIFLQKNQAQIIKAYSELTGLDVRMVEAETEINRNSDVYHQLIKNLEVLESITFPEFVMITEHLFTKDNMDAHFAPQSDVMMRDHRLLVDHFFKLENIGESWSGICKLLSTNIVLSGGMNRTNFEGPEKYKRFYNEDLCIRVSRLYHKDFANFNYPIKIIS